MKSFHRFLAVFSILFLAGSAYAGVPEPWQLGFQEAATPVMERLERVYDLLLVIIYAIGIFVTILLAYTCIRYRAKRNPVPSKNTHNTLIEVIWTVIPVLILFAISIPSMRFLYYAQKIENADMTVKVIGSQWFWSYQYPDHSNIAFDSYIIKDADLQPGQKRLLEVDNSVVVPVDTTVRIQTTAADVIHSWAIPAFGVKIDAVPGKLNETWFKAIKTGDYYGQCSELCGVGHGFMPIHVKVVTKEEFATWVEEAKKKFAN